MLNTLLFKRLKVWLMLLGVFSSLVVSAQTRVTGRVIGADDKQPVIGASVKVSGTTVGTVTDANGNFSITAKPTDVISVSYLGYQTQNVTVGSQTALRITLSTSTSTLNEVVVTGYTSQRKQDITGAVATVDLSQAKKIPVTSSEQLLQGQASGVTVITNGIPGGGSTVLVRGVSSLGGSQPLYVIDGVQSGDMSNVNPNDIESISVLKDAGSAAIYGVSGGNGVVVVTTKKGRQGKTTISYDGYYGVTTPLGGNPYNLLDAPGIATLTYKVNPATLLYPNGKVPDFGYQAGVNLGGGKGIANAGDPLVDPSKYHFDAQNPDNDYLIQAFNKQGTDWFHTVFKNAPTQSHTLTMSGANDKNSYLLSAGYLNQQGTLIDTYLKRYSARVNTTFNIKNNIRVGESAYAFFRQSPGGFNNQSEGSALSWIYRTQPSIPVYDINGNYGGTWDGPTELGNANTPFAVQERTKTNQNRQWNVQGNLFAEVDFLKHFTARTSVNGNIYNNFYNSIIYNQYNDGENHNTPNGAVENTSFASNIFWSNTIVYKQVFGKHNVDFLGGYEINQTYGRFLQGSVNTLFSLDPNYVNLNNGTTNIQTQSYAYQPTSKQSVFARVNYQYNDKYLFSATVRRDGSSVFAPQTRYGTFPSATVGWRISQEDFLKSVNWLTDLKLRASYGSLGSNNISATNAFTLFGSGFGQSSYPITGSSNVANQGFYNNGIGNAGGKWETDKILNVGIDATLFRNLTFNLEYYEKSISGLLFQASLPATLGGATAPFINSGNISNKGFDFNVTYNGKAGRDFNYNVGVEVTPYTNKFTYIPGNGYLDVSGSRLGNLVREAIGQPVGEFFGYKQIGYFKDAADVSSSPTQNGAAPGRFKYQDVNGDGKIDANDRTFFGNPNPKFTYGVNLGANYKGFDASVILYGSQGNKNINFTKFYTNFYATLIGNKSNDLLYNSWSPTNLNPKTPIAENATSFSTSEVFSSYYMEDGSFLKCRQASIGYTFSPQLLKNIQVDRLRIYFQVTNLFTITKYSGLDPELQPSSGNLGTYQQSGAFGIDYGNYPNNQRGFLLGLGLTF
ncbi:TonB-dependent receptor [uncultured Mucilaginibacter sp.]|uniref:SusC/RagA family TonB-linked outer membrane protein n=1 Tax=uncultured Mucilaginibacter sp. TaxID=797541 RepID=UPI00261B91EB|nr:TonB-dependent receptor [uncultured Mucilaginibacter sp.]